MPDERPDGATPRPPVPGGGWNIPLLIIGAGVALTLTVYPRIAAASTGKADHLGLLLLMWAMSASFVRGVGFVPRLMVLRALLSAPAALIALAAGIWRLMAV